MKTIYLCLLIMLVTSFQLSAQTWDWTHPEPNGIAEIPVGGNSNGAESDKVHDIETDANGNVYVLGDFRDSLYLNNKVRPTAEGSSGSYLAKYDSTGNLLWYKLITNTNASPYEDAIKATDLTVTSKGIFITGKYMPTRVICSSYDCSTGMNTCPTIPSYRIGNITFNSGFDEIGFFVTKFNANGAVVWNKLGTSQSCFDGGYRGPGYMQLGDVDYPLIASDKNNNIICEFTFMGNDANVVTLGTDNIPLPTPISGDALIVFKMNNAGVMQWSNYASKATNAGTSHDCNSLITDKNGNAFLYGVASDSCKFGSIYYRSHYRENEEGIVPYSTFIAKISSTGTWQFAKELCNSSRNYLSWSGGTPDLLATDNNNNIYALVITNSSYGVITGDTVSKDKTNAYLIKLDNNGNTIFHKGFGNTDTYANSVNFANSSLYISGGIRNGSPWYFSNLSSQPGSGNNGVFEYYVAKANINGDFQWVSSFAGISVNEGCAVKAFGSNVYTGGYYRDNLTTLGNLNGTYSYPNENANIFFGKLKDQYIRVGAVTPTQLIPGCTITIPFTSFGLNFTAGNTFTAELSDVNGDFTTPTAIGTITSKGTGSITAIIPASLTYGSGFRVRIRSSDTLKTGFNYYAYADTGYKLFLTCPAPSSGFSATNITATSAKLTWNAVPCAAGYKVQYRVKGTTTWTTKNIATNTSTINITGLTANTIYQWHVATKCRNNGTTSFSAFSTTKQFTTASAFTAKNTAAMMNSDDKVNIFVQPNPARTTVVLMIKGVVKNATVSITDLTGKLLWQTNAVNSNQVTLPVEHLAAGIYLIKLVNGNEIKVVKLVKE